MADPLKVERVPIASLSPDPANVRLHPERNLDTIKGSLRRFGQQKPIVVDGDGIVRAGNGTLAAAKALGWTEIDVCRTALKGAEAIAFAIADNRSGELAEWDREGLEAQLEALRAEGVALPEIGFDQRDLDVLFGEDSIMEPMNADPTLQDGFSPYTEKVIVIVKDQQALASVKTAVTELCRERFASVTEVMV